MLKNTLMGLALALTATAATADAITVEDAYARSANPMTGAAFMMITNTTDTDDRLIAARSDAARRVELHTHIDEDGLMRMVHVEEGFVLPAGATLHMKRGAEHVMFMGLEDPFEQGDTVTVTLVFEQAGEVTVEVPVDLERQDMGMGHGNMDYGDMDHGSDDS